MKTIRNVIVVIAVAAAQWCVTAATVDVATVAELTNAVARANAGEKIDGDAIDTIVLKAGTYAPSAGEFMLDDGSVKSFLNVQVGNLTITGEDESPRKMWTSGSEPVVIDMGNIGRFVRHANGGLMVKNIAVTGSRIASGYGTIVYGANQWLTPSIFTNCVFRQNAGTQSAFWGHYYRLDDCTYVANSCMLSGYLRGCDISDNTSRMEYIHQMHECTVSGQSLASSSALVGLSTTDLDTIVSNCTFRANKNNGGIFNLTQSAKIADCVFENNTNTLILATLDDTKSVLVSNCTFRSNTTSSTHPIIACDDSDVRIVNCEFPGNSNDSTTPLIRFSNSSATKTNDCLLAGCTFSGNAASALTMFNGTNPLNGSLTVTNCSFIGNTANATAATGEMPVTTVRVLVRGIVGDENRCMIYDSVFSNNQSKVVSGAMGLCNVLGVHAVRCTFTGDGEKPYSSYTTGNWRYYNEAADNSILEECDVSNGEMRDCVVDRCRIHNVTSNVYAVFKDSAFVTNTLVECCGSTSVASYLYSSIYKHDAEFVNCTIVSNNCFTFSLNASAGSSVSCIIDDCRFVNCLFNANRADFITTVSDFTIEDKDACLNCFVDHVEFAHSAYGIFTPHSRFTATAFATKTNGVDTLTLCANPKFVKDSRPDAPYWSLLPKSPLIGKGDASIWTAEDVDLVGKLRLKDGKVDPGCYQCWINPPGMAIFVR